MTADLPNNPPDRQIRRRLKFMVDCMIRLTASLNEVGPRLPLLLLPEFDEEVDQDNFDVCVLPITPFRTENDANAVWEKASQALVDYNVGPSNVLNEIDGIFEELASTPLSIPAPRPEAEQPWNVTSSKKRQCSWWVSLTRGSESQPPCE